MFSKHGPEAVPTQHKWRGVGRGVGERVWQRDIRRERREGYRERARDTGDREREGIFGRKRGIGREGLGGVGVDGVRRESDIGREELGRAAGPQSSAYTLDS